MQPAVNMSVSVLSTFDGSVLVSQVLSGNLPVALAAVDCDGNETSITECQNNDGFIGRCKSSSSRSTVLACADSVDGVIPALPDVL